MNELLYTLLFLCSVSILLKIGRVNRPWQGQPQGYRPTAVLSFWSVLARIVGFCFGFAVMAFVALVWLFSYAR